VKRLDADSTTSKELGKRFHLVIGMILKKPVGAVNRRQSRVLTGVENGLRELSNEWAYVDRPGPGLLHSNLLVGSAADSRNLAGHYDWEHSSGAGHYRTNRYEPRLITGCLENFIRIYFQF
jgi:hypothetical protein